MVGGFLAIRPLACTPSVARLRPHLDRLALRLRRSLKQSIGGVGCGIRRKRGYHPARSADEYHAVDGIYIGRLIIYGLVHGGSPIITTRQGRKRHRSKWAFAMMSIKGSRGDA
jgi:hypothetical protein